MGSKAVENLEENKNFQDAEKASSEEPLERKREFSRKNVNLGDNLAAKNRNWRSQEREVLEDYPEKVICHSLEKLVRTIRSLRIHLF